MSTLIRDAVVVTVDRDSTIHDPGAVLIDGTRIVDLGPSDALAARYPDAERVDGRRKLLIPGLVSTHTHVGNTLFRGRAEDAGLGCVGGMYLPMGVVVQPGERLAVGSLTYAELLRSGVTTVLEMEPGVEVYAPFVERLGLRSAMGVMVNDVDMRRFCAGDVVFDETRNAAQMAEAVAFAERWHGAADGRITALITPDMTICSSPRQLAAARAAADRLGLRLSTHCGWGAEEVAITRRLHGLSPFEYLDRHGLLAADVVVAHCYHMDEADFDRLARGGAAVSHCPLMNSVRGQIAPALAMRERGIRLSLGIDNMFDDFLEVLRACVAMARVHAGHPTAMLCHEALELATAGGAAALGMADSIGSIEVGKRADLVMIDMRPFGLAPVLDPVQDLVWHGHARDVHTVWVDGRVVVRDGTLVNADEAQLVDAAESAAQAAWGRFVATYGGIMAPSP